MTAEPYRRTYRPEHPLDLAVTLAPLRRGDGFDQSFRVVGDTTWRATRNPDGPVTMSIRRVGEAIELEAWGPGAAQALERGPALLGAEDDWSDFRPELPMLRDLLRRRPGLRLCRAEAVFELLVPAVMEQKVIGHEARRGYRRLVQALGEPAPGPLPMLVPPTAATLAHLPYWRFHPFALERRRAETVMRAALHAPRLEALVHQPAAAAREALVALPGIGPWTANLVTLLALGDADAVPIGDYHIPGLVSFALAGERGGDDARMLELLEPYAGHRARVIRLLVGSRLGPPRRGPRLAFRHLERH